MGEKIKKFLDAIRDRFGWEKKKLLVSRGEWNNIQKPHAKKEGPLKFQSRQKLRFQLDSFTFRIPYHGGLVSCLSIKLSKRAVVKKSN